ncbi:hypothetical protein [Nocardia sp. CY41]|uniref:hypothetical protein n=1 Tax=Nocardia sp. CY41 TaxID=2608686 RepID=UPI001916B5EC|nr:hypothetical protein [Nocardia sp. CY41]
MSSATDAEAAHVREGDLFESPRITGIRPGVVFPSTTGTGIAATARTTGRRTS